MNKFAMKLCLVGLLALSLLIGGLWAATTKPPTVNIDIGHIQSGSVGTGTINVHGAASGVVNYSWGLDLQKALSDVGTKEKIQQMVESYLAEGTSIATTAEIITATLLSSGTGYYINGSETSAFDPYDIYGIRSRSIGGRNAGTSYSVSDTGQETVSINFDNVGLFEVNLTGEQTLEKYQVTGDSLISPIVLDMDGDGKLMASNGKWLPHPGEVDKASLHTFDLDGNGFDVLTEWVGKGDGLLCEPKADGSVDGSCLFGTTGGYQDGFSKLSLRDTNGDGVLTDKELDGLVIWTDTNNNARAEKDELTSVKAAGITMIDLNAKNFAASFEINGQKRTMWDWWPNCLSLMKVASR